MNNFQCVKTHKNIHHGGVKNKNNMHTSSYTSLHHIIFSAKHVYTIVHRTNIETETHSRHLGPTITSTMHYHRIFRSNPPKEQRYCLASKQTTIWWRMRASGPKVGPAGPTIRLAGLLPPPLYKYRAPSCSLPQAQLKFTC